LKYKSVIVTKRGGPEVLQVIESDLRAPLPGEARVKILAAPVCLPDVEARSGRTPFPVKIPFVPGYANPFSFSRMLRFLAQVILFNLLPNGRSAKYYGTGSSRLNRRPFLEDWATLFRLLEEGKIKPVIMKTFPILEAAQANELLESGQVIGNIVLVAPDLL
jgi:NADPH:quinone reductase-like Zn-dependent oxidoreductase